MPTDCVKMLGLCFQVALLVAFVPWRAAQQPNAGDAKSGVVFRLLIRVGELVIIDGLH